MLFAIDVKDWADVADKMGVAFVVLLMTFFGLFWVVRWLTRNAVKPLVDSHVSLIDSIKNSNQQIADRQTAMVTSTNIQNEKLEKIADAAGLQNKKLDEVVVAMAVHSKKLDDVETASLNQGKMLGGVSDSIEEQTTKLIEALKEAK